MSERCIRCQIPLATASYAGLCWKCHCAIANQDEVEKFQRGIFGPKEIIDTAGWIKIPEANLRAIEAENADLRTQLEDYRDMVVRYQDENAALKQKLSAVREWMDSRQADSVVKLRKILDGE